jgi:hypothetical protein
VPPGGGLPDVLKVTVDTVPGAVGVGGLPVQDFASTLVKSANGNDRFSRLSRFPDDTAMVGSPMLAG